VFDLVASVEKSISERSACRRGEHILAAVSGGVDSMVLLQVLHTISRKHGWKLTVAHFNHQLRGRSSDADERLVRRTAQALGVRIMVGRGNVRAFARRNALSLEMAARQLRHEFLALAARRLKIRKIALAHHADDQVELFFLRLLRGAGSEGLSGMKFVAPSPADSHLQLLRPLLDYPKRMLLDFARLGALPFREDASNATLEILRNRIRRELLPFLQRNYQPAIGPAVLRAMNILTEEAGFIAAEADRWLHATKPQPFARLPVAVQRRVLLHELQHLELPADFETVEALRLRPDAPVNLGPELSVSRTPEGLLRVNWHRPPEFRDEQKLIDLNARAGHAQLDEVAFRWNIDSTAGPDIPKPMPRREFFDADAIGDTVRLRHWRPGDRFQPIGMKAAVKLQDLFTNRKIPAELRRQLVVAENSAGKIFWVEGLRIGECAKVRSDTERRLTWKWQRRGPKRSLQAPAHRASVAHLKNHGRRQSK
jgi:tRNA(Ile)-lysidine synthase